MSESALDVQLEFEGGLTLTAVIDRVLGPLIVEEIKFRLPIVGKAAVMAGQVKMTLGISKGNLKATSEVKRGEMAYNPLGDSLDVYLKDMHTFGPVNLIGRITSDSETLERLSTIRRGGRVIIRAAHDARTK